MTDKYYFDTSIWIDLIEDRKGYHDEPLGKYASMLVLKILTNKENLVMSDIVLEELRRRVADHTINSMLNPLKHQILKVFPGRGQLQEASHLSITRKIPIGDALHAILSRDNNLILVTRDNDFKKLLDITNYHKPEDLL